MAQQRSMRDQELERFRRYLTVLARTQLKPRPARQGRSLRRGPANAAGGVPGPRPVPAHAGRPGGLAAAASWPTTSKTKSASSAPPAAMRLGKVPWRPPSTTLRRGLPSGWWPTSPRPASGPCVRKTSAGWRRHWRNCRTSSGGRWSCTTCKAAPWPRSPSRWAGPRGRSPSWSSAPCKNYVVF